MLTIGQFSSVSHVSARMLRHYDIIGLLRPHHTDADSGYRYYDEKQLAVVSRIEALKAYGFTLREIKDLLLLPPSRQAQWIHEKRLDQHKKLVEIKRNLRRMEEELLQTEGTEMMHEKYDVIVMQMPPQKVFGIKKTISVAETHDLFKDLQEQCKRHGYRRTGPTQLTYLGEEFSYEDMAVEAQIQVEGEGEGIHVLPGGSYLATTHTGPYESVRYAYDAIAAYLASHPEYTVCGPAIERYIKDEETVKNPEELETGVLFPVCEKTP
ncbi:MerR family transcriptional regulator [Ruminococcaceae bacterium OttesenSCG-928-I18]|nr:MerR family transcriptional regulator [Ruminococcaceae bacterium OttesenSCG-928-I18]